MTDALIDLTVHIDRPREQVFAAWSTAEAMAAWFAPMADPPPDVEMDFEVGGEYSIVMPLPDGSVHTTKGEYQDIVENEKIVMTWHCDAFPDPASVVEVQFTISGTGTNVQVRHHSFESQTTCDNHRMGWQMCLDGLVGYMGGT